VGLQYRAIRAAATALLVATAVGTGGMVGMGSALAADPAMVGLAGTVVDHGGAPLGGVHLVITEELPPDGGIAAFQVTTAADGSFATDVYAWGAADAPATVTIATPANEELEVIGHTCSQTWGVAVDPGQAMSLVGVAPDPLTLKATTTLLGEVCGTTATPPPNNSSGHGSGNSSGGRPGLTPPPTDTFRGPMTAAPDRLGPALTIGFAIGLLAAAAFLLLHRGARRRD
jgi:hypothetical protein